MPRKPEPGRELLGRYRLEVCLDEGGMGQIWRAEHLVLGAPVAVKIVDRDVSRDEEALARFNLEAQSAAQLRSPHVVQIFDYGIDGGLPFIVMELLEGETLAKRLKRRKRLSPEETARVITHVARAVSRAHEAKIVHRDLKPENVFLVHNEEEDVAKVLDFGVVKVSEATLGPKGERTRTGSLLGTPFYMSPEQAQGNKTVDFRTDLWALGVMAFECLTGKRPFESEGLGDLVLSICVRPLPVPSEYGPVPAGFDEWFKKATEREPRDRFQSARQLAVSLRKVLSDESREVQVTIPDSDDEWGAEPERQTAAGVGPTSGATAAETEPGQTAPATGEATTVEASAEDLERLKGKASESEPAVPPDIAVSGDTMASVIPVRRGPKPWVIATVAAGALAVGGTTGIVMMQSEMAEPDPTDTPVARPALTPEAVVTPANPTGPITSNPTAVKEDASSADPESSAAEEPDAAPVRDAASDGLSPAAQRAAAIMKGLEERDATAAPAPTPSASHGN